MSEPILALQQASFAHPGGPEIIRNLNIEIFPGDQLAILGANGSGKSTLLRLLAGSWRVTCGQLFCHGREVTARKKERDRLRRSVQLVLQEPDEMLFALSVAADVSYGPVNLGLSTQDVKERVESALAALEITDLAQKVPHQLSYGQRKRVALAGAIAMQPEVLLLDEPSAGLDPQATRTLWRLLADLAAQGTAVVITSHDLDFAYEFASRAAVLVDGQLVNGQARELLADHDLAARARLTPAWAPLVERLAGQPIKNVADVLALLEQRKL